MLQIDNLVKSYKVEGGQKVTVLDIRHFAMQAGEKATLVGPSGSGKSTLLQMISGILRPTEGRIQLQGLQLDQLGEAELDRFRAQHIGYVFQSFNLLPGFTALENVLVAMRFGSALPRKERRARAIDLLSQVGLGHRLHHRSGQLSHGEQQRVSIARALANRPVLVLADEPTASLDSDNARQVFNLLTEACRDQGAALLLCTHDMELAGQLDRMVHIRDLSGEEK
jgi:ABC-type lipoprotein export system ATPase subunit